MNRPRTAMTNMCESGRLCLNVSDVQLETLSTVAME